MGSGVQRFKGSGVPASPVSVSGAARAVRAAGAAAALSSGAGALTRGRRTPHHSRARQPFDQVRALARRTCRRRARRDVCLEVPRTVAALYSKIGMDAIRLYLCADANFQASGWASCRILRATDAARRANTRPPDLRFCLLTVAVAGNHLLPANRRRWELPWNPRVRGGFPMMIRPAAGVSRPVVLAGVHRRSHMIRGLAMWSVAVAAAGAQDPARKRRRRRTPRPRPPPGRPEPGSEAGKLGGTSDGQKVVPAHVLSMNKLAEDGDATQPPDRFSTAATSPASSSSRRRRLSGRTR